MECLSVPMGQDALAVQRTLSVHLSNRELDYSPPLPPRSPQRIRWSVEGGSGSSSHVGILPVMMLESRCPHLVQTMFFYPAQLLFRSVWCGLSYASAQALKCVCQKEV